MRLQRAEPLWRLAPSPSLASRNRGRCRRRPIRSQTSAQSNVRNQQSIGDRCDLFGRNSNRALQRSQSSRDGRVHKRHYARRIDGFLSRTETAQAGNRVDVLWPGVLINQLRIFALLAQFRLS
ncbi:hypothetical protein BOC52_02440 [Burkholderia pseudomallei]|nr:hypothetical protein BOC52_02440 [Burkholderia pseudomallei]ARL63017.1 hypothetical protein BOC53_05440 [Burkholderia pseudomallei]